MYSLFIFIFFFFSSRRRHTRCSRDWSSDVCSSDLARLSAGDAVNAFAVLAACGVYGQPHFLAQRPADEPAYAVRLPAGGLHDLGERRAALPLEQAEDRGLLAAVAGCGGLVATFGAFRFGCLGRFRFRGVLR